MAFVPQAIASNSGNSSTASCSYPSGLVSGALLTLTIAVNDRFDMTATTPTGWTLAQKGGVPTSAPYAATFYKISDGTETGTADSTLGAGTNWHAKMIRWSGNVTSSPLNTSSQSLDDASNTTATSATMTPSVAGCGIVYIVVCTTSRTVSGYTFTTSPPTFTEYTDSADASGLTIAVAYGERPETTATSTGSATLSGAARSVVHLLAIELTTSIPYTITAAQGSYTLTGIAASFSKALRMASDVGTYALTGFDALLNIGTGYRLAADAGAYVLTGFDVILRVGYSMAAAAGSYALTGYAAALLKGYNVVLASGSYVLTGFSARFPLIWRTLTKNVVSFSNIAKNVASWVSQSKTNI